MKKINKVLVALSILFVFGIFLIVSNSKVFASDENRITGNTNDVKKVETNLVDNVNNLISYYDKDNDNKISMTQDGADRFRWFWETRKVDINQTYTITNDSDIINVVPKECFKTLGINYALGDEYGFITYTDYFNKTSTVTNVIIFKIRNYKYINTKDNVTKKIITEVQPIKKGNYIYSIVKGAIKDNAKIKVDYGNIIIYTSHTYDFKSSNKVTPFLGNFDSKIYFKSISTSALIKNANKSIYFYGFDASEHKGERTIYTRIDNIQKLQQDLNNDASSLFSDIIGYIPYVGDFWGIAQTVNDFKTFAIDITRSLFASPTNEIKKIEAYDSSNADFMDPSIKNNYAFASNFKKNSDIIYDLTYSDYLSTSFAYAEDYFCFDAYCNLNVNIGFIIKTGTGKKTQEKFVEVDNNYDVSLSVKNNGKIKIKDSINYAYNDESLLYEFTAPTTGVYDFKSYNSNTHSVILDFFSQDKRVKSSYFNGYVDLNEGETIYIKLTPTVDTYYKKYYYDENYSFYINSNSIGVTNSFKVEVYGYAHIVENSIVNRISIVDKYVVNKDIYGMDLTSDFTNTKYYDFTVDKTAYYCILTEGDLDTILFIFVNGKLKYIDDDQEAAEDWEDTNYNVFCNCKLYEGDKITIIISSYQTGRTLITFNSYIYD